MELSELKSRLLKLLEIDEEFRYAVAGRLGILEVLRRLDGIEASINKLWEGQQRLWEEVRSIREDQQKLWENQNKLWESQQKLWEEVRGLREEQIKLREEQARLAEEQTKLREEQIRLAEGQAKLAEEQFRLREEQIRLAEEQARLAEEQARLAEEQAMLREEQIRLAKEQARLAEEQAMLREEQIRLAKEQARLAEEQTRLAREQAKLRASFESFGRALGVTLEHYAASFVQLMLEEMGFPEAKVDRKLLLHEGEVYEVDIFCEEPLTVGEATLYVGDVDEARRELDKLLRRVEVAEKTTGKKARMKLLAVGNVPSQVLKYLEEQAEELGVRLLYGRELIA